MYGEKPKILCSETQKNTFGFPYEPYPIQQQLMMAIFQAIDERKVGIFESPTGTGKSLSTICASLSWLEQMQKKKKQEIDEQIHHLERKIKETDADDDWIKAHGQKLEAQKQLSDVELSKQHLTKIQQRLDKANANCKEQKKPSKASKRKEVFNNQSEEDATNEFDQLLLPKQKEEDADLMPDESELCSKGEAEEEVLKSTKIIYASRTHSQLEQFTLELDKTNFYPRTVTLGSRQVLCINEQVRSLKFGGLVNDRCNELLNAKTNSSEIGKRIRDASGAMIKKPVKKCGCEFAKSDAIEDLADQILSRNQRQHSSSMNDMSGVTKAGRELQACPYFSSRRAMPLCELVLVPYNILLHKSTREAWNLDLKDNVVIIDEAHNLLQTLSGIHSVELDEGQLETSSSLIHDYMERFRLRLSPRNFLYIRQLHTLTNALRRQLKNASSLTEMDQGTVFTLSGFIGQLSISEIDLFKVLEYLNQSKLCRKLRDFHLRFLQVNFSANVQGQTPKSSSKFSSPDNAPLSAPKSASRPGSVQGTPSALTSKTPQTPVPSSKFGSALQKLRTSATINKENASPKSSRKKLECTADKVSKAKGESVSHSSKPQSTSTPLYQLKEFIEALTTKAEDARIIVQKETRDVSAKLRFLLLNPADKLREVVQESRSVILIGGTMRPIDQLEDAFQRVCELPSERILQFSCGHVVGESQLIALSISRGPNQVELNLNFSNRRNQQVMVGISQCFVNLLRHIPNGSVAFFPSYSFLEDFIRSVKESGHFALIEKVKPIFVESRDMGVEDIWIKFCSAARGTRQGALLLSVVGGKLSEGINFSDELGRCVFMVGLPYANKSSIELKERMKYLEENIGSGAGKKYYETLCIQAVNQAIGRVIRHKNDHAAIILLDARYADTNMALPGWIKERLFHCLNFSDALTKMISFFKSSIH